ncbi:MAG TPA: Xaa-Pro peptidase family protein [Terriglobales bacterium]|nr:Xaa-Pro peptidase family protein [Terriglobales bacterium]
MDYQARQEKVRSAIGDYHLDGLVVTHLPNIRYLCGFAGSAGALVVLPQSNNVFFADGRYEEQARAEVVGAAVVIGRKSPLVAAGEWLATQGRKPKVLGIEPEHLTVGEGKLLRKTAGPGLRIRPAPPLVEQARMVKDPQEIAHLGAAARLGASLFEVALKTIRPGIKEVEVAAEMEYAARQAGAEGMSFATIVASGKRSALPHGRASSARIPARGFVVCDFGVILAGYCSDMTRTVHVGTPGAKARHIYCAVRAAQQGATEAVGPGVSIGKVHARARKLLNQQKLVQYFQHSTGHGVGLEIHEAPRIAAGQQEPLRAGMVITIEPGVYVPGFGGVRIEDMVAVTERGCQIFTPTTKELIEL